jgi:hypothetical protein
MKRMRLGHDLKPERGAKRGRPEVPAKYRKRPITMTLDPDLVRWLRKRARSRGWSVSAVAADILKRSQRASRA